MCKVKVKKNGEENDDVRTDRNWGLPGNDCPGDGPWDEVAVDLRLWRRDMITTLLSTPLLQMSLFHLFFP